MTSSTKFCNAASEFVTVDGARMHYLRAGSGPPLLLLHGLVGSTCTWKRNVDGLAEHFTVYAIDMIGMGASDRVRGLDASMRAKAKQLCGFMDALGLPAVTIAAHSHGGAVSMTFASMYPERLKGLVLVAPANPYSCASDKMLRFYLSPMGRMFARCVPWLPREILHIGLQRMYGDPKRMKNDALSGYIECLQVPGTVDHIMQILKTWSDDMKLLRSALKAGAMKGKPVLLMWGDRDIAVPVESGRALYDRLKGARMVVLPGVGHIPCEELPEQCNRILVEWAQAQGLTEAPEREERTSAVLTAQTA